MDFYQGVVVDYLRADRAIFVNTEYCIQVNPSPNPDTSGPHWYCDAVACDFRSHTVWLCEITYSKTLSGLVKRLNEWHQNWPGVCAALNRDSHLPDGWQVRVWIFVPGEFLVNLGEKLKAIRATGFRPKITPLEWVQPWRYRSWDHRDGPEGKPSEIPEEMRA